MADDGLKAAADARGLQRFLSQFPDELARARDGAANLRAQIPDDIEQPEEPAHMFRVPDGPRG